MKYFFVTVSILLLVVIIGGFAFYFGRQSANQSKEMTTTPTPTVESQTPNTSQTPTPQAVEKNGKIVEAGGVLSFPNYSLLIPNDWNSQREQGQDSDKLTLTKGAYKITISEAAFGGGGCLYPGNPPSEFAQTYTTFVEIQNPNGYVFRRSTSSTGGWTLCQKNAQDGSFGTPTMFGHINITTPQVTDATVMAEVDSIFTFIKRK